MPILIFVCLFILQQTDEHTDNACDVAYYNRHITVIIREQRPLLGCSRSVTTVKACWMLASSVTSIWTAVKCDEHTSRRALAPSAIRHIPMTWHPAASSRCAACLPKPESQPVISTYRPPGPPRTNCRWTIQSQTRKKTNNKRNTPQPTSTASNMTTILSSFTYTQHNRNIITVEIHYFLSLVYMQTT